MNVEILKVKNGYMVRPLSTNARGDYTSYSIEDRVYVFSDYVQLSDNLKDILEMETSK